MRGDNTKKEPRPSSLDGIAQGRQIGEFGLDMDFWILKIKIQSKKIETKSKILYLLIFWIWIGLKKKIVSEYF